MVIGANGYTGSRVAVSLAVAGHQVTVLRRPGGRGRPTSQVDVY